MAKTIDDAIKEHDEWLRKQYMDAIAAVHNLGAIPDLRKHLDSHTEALIKDLTAGLIKAMDRI